MSTDAVTRVLGLLRQTDMTGDRVALAEAIVTAVGLAKETFNVDLRAEMFAARERVMAEHPELMLITEIEPLLPEYLRAEYLRWNAEN